MYANLKKEVLDNEGKVIFRNTFSLDATVTSKELFSALLKVFTDQGYDVEFATKRIY